MEKINVVNWQEARSYINSEIFKKRTNELFTAEDIYEGITKRLSSEGRTFSSMLKQQILGTLTYLTLSNVLTKVDDNTYKIRTKLETKK